MRREYNTARTRFITDEHPDPRYPGIRAYEGEIINGQWQCRRLRFFATLAQARAWLT